MDISGLSAKDMLILFLVALLLWHMVHGDSSAAQSAATGNEINAGAMLAALAAFLRKDR